ncbi:MAG TPA: orotidine-5'-phosphate decarboxylase [Archaeoglobus profundus]|nr:orotidine-5'-phosphate decarboxylase [Archaeoglobus profundus]
MVDLILALDVLDGNRAKWIAEEVKDYISAIKVNYPLILSSGISIMRELSEIKPVIADFKIADIPYISSLIAEIAFKNGASAIIVHGFSGRESVEAVLEVAKRYNGEVYVVTELTSSSEYFSNISIKIARMAKEMGCDGIIAPGNKPERIREFRKVVDDLKILCPGIGVQGGDLREVIANGADGIIVGRTIYNSENPRSTAKKLFDLIKNSIKKL